MIILLIVIPPHKLISDTAYLRIFYSNGGKDQKVSAFNKRIRIFGSRVNDMRTALKNLRNSTKKVEVRPPILDRLWIGFFLY